MVRNLSNGDVKSTMKEKPAKSDKGDKDLTKIVLGVYDCDNHPLSYMIEPRGSIRFTKDTKVTKEELENIF